MATQHNTSGDDASQSSSPSGRRARGFAAMDQRTQEAIARKGGEAVSRNREHMSEIGRKGGEARGHRNRSQTESLRDTQRSEPDQGHGVSDRRMGDRVGNR